MLLLRLFYKRIHTTNSLTLYQHLHNNSETMSDQLEQKSELRRSKKTFKRNVLDCLPNLLLKPCRNGLTSIPSSPTTIFTKWDIGRTTTATTSTSLIPMMPTGREIPNPPKALLLSKGQNDLNLNGIRRSGGSQSLRWG